ncbi:nucleotide sugar epimerase [archaeon]|nr:nucleotide sugar epimerase [archaeon]
MSENEQKNILVTGGAGFIGSHLSRYLANQGHKVTILDNFTTGDLRNIWDMLSHNQVKLIKGDIRDSRLLTDITTKTDIIFHLAAQIHVDKSVLEPIETFDINATGTLKILELAMKRDFERIIYASTSEVYGSAMTDKINEDHPTNSQSPYAASKLAADRLCYSYAKSYDMDIAVIRNFNTYGPHQKDSGYGAVIPLFIKRVLANKPPVIYGTGEQSRDFMYIEDAIKAYSLTLDSNKTNGKVINFGSGKDISIKDLAYKIIEICGSDLEPVFVEQRPGEVQKLCADITKAKEILGFNPEFDIEKGLQAYIDWFKKYKFDEWKIE